jgi:hypothetical protein
MSYSRKAPTIPKQLLVTPRQLLVLVPFFATLLGADSARAQEAKAAGNKDSAAQETVASSDTRVTSATALGDIFFKSRDSFVFSVTAEEAVYDNLFFSEEANKRFDAVSNISPRIAYQREYQRSTIALDYTLGSRIYHQYDSYNQLAHNGGLDLHYRLTPRVSFSVGERFSVAPESIRPFEKDMVVDPLQNHIAPNTSLFLRLNKTLINTAFTDVSYELGRRSGLTLGANSSIMRFTQSNLTDEDRYGAHIGYSYRLAERTTLNLRYIFNYFELTDSQVNGGITSFVRSPQLVRTHLAYVGITQKLNSSLSGFVNVGPSVTIGNSVNTAQGLRFHPGVRPSIDAGIVLGKAVSLDPRTFFSFNIGQSTSDGMGIGPVAEVKTAGVSLGRRLSKSITAAITANYYHNNFLTDFNSSGQPATTNGIIIGSNLRIGLTDRVFLHATYNHFRQVSTASLAAVPGNILGNIGIVGLSYSIPVFF